VTEPLRLAFTVHCEQSRAFATWAERFSSWWPGGHSVSGAPAEVVLEPHLGGRIYERTAAGHEIPWGEVTVWEPPRRLGYLWHLRRDRADATDVEIAFVDQGDGTTRVEIAHSGWERLGADAGPWRERNERAWHSLIPHYTEVAER
jgi:Activator of Hsp90 ATPase homolog 1-like protein